MTKEQAIKQFFDVALRGESNTYDDHNYYTSSGLKSYIKGKMGKPYPLLNKNLSEYKIGDVIKFQQRPRDANGQLWATGRYQIIPSTLRETVKKVGLTENDLYNQANQDRLAWQLLMNKKNLRDYIIGASADSTQNLERASLDMAMIWSSIGIPFTMGNKAKNQSYYGSDVASVKTEDIQSALKKTRQLLLGKVEKMVTQSVSEAKKKPVTTIILVSVTIFAGFILWKYLKKNKK